MTTVIETPEGPLPVPVPWAGHPPPIPHVGNPLPALVDQTERKWETVAGWVSSTWHKGVSFLEGAGSLALSDIEGIVDTAINTAQTAWSTYINLLEDWITIGIDELGTAVGEARLAARGDAIQLAQMIEALGIDALGWVGDAETIARNYTDLVIDGLAQALVRGLVNTETWAIDNIYHPLLGDIERVRADLLDWTLGALADTQTWVREQITAERLARLAEIAGVIGTLAALESWVAECGAPMCELIGPGTALAGLLGNAELLELLAMLLALKTLTDPEEVARAAQYVTDALAPALGATIEAWVAPLLDAIPG